MSQDAYKVGTSLRMKGRGHGRVHWEIKSSHAQPWGEIIYVLEGRRADGGIAQIERSAKALDARFEEVPPNEPMPWR